MILLILPYFLKTHFRGKQQRYQGNLGPTFQLIYDDIYHFLRPDPRSQEFFIAQLAFTLI